MGSENKPCSSTIDSKDDSIFSESLFANLDISKELKDALDKHGFIKMTKVQEQTILPLLAKKDVVASARTGSGKTLAFLVPAIQLLLEASFSTSMGTGALIIAPTRELAIQIFVVAKTLTENMDLSLGLVIGGAPKHSEAEHLSRGVNLLVATPGRLLDHMLNTSGFVYSNLKALIIDEADRCLEVGFEREMHAIMNRLPEERQTLLFSATQTQKMDDLIAISVKDPLYVGVDDEREVSTATNLTQGYIVCPSDTRFLLLYAFLKRNLKNKVIVFMCSCKSVQFYGDLLNHINIPVMTLHGRQKQSKRTSTFNSFMEADAGVLICTDVAARGLDIPNVDWIIQYDPTDDPKEYIHRVGRACRGGSAREAKALMFLLPEELEFLNYLKAAKVPVNEFEFPKNKVPNIQAHLEKTVGSIFSLTSAATVAFKSYIAAYSTHSMKKVFNVQKLDLKKVATSFCLTVPPRVTIGPNK